MASNEDRIVFAARTYTEFRRPDGSTYVVRHKRSPVDDLPRRRDRQ